MSDDEYEYDDSLYDDANYAYYGDGSGYAGGDYSQYDYWEESVSKGIGTYMPPVLLVCGICGNVISALVMTRLGFHTLSTCLYLAVLAALDVILVCIRSGNDWTKNMWGADITRMILSQSNVSCQVYSFLCQFMNHMSGCTLAAAFVEYTFAVANPERAHTMCTRERVKNALLLVTLLLVCSNAHVFWTYGMVAPFAHSKERYCGFTPYGSHYSEIFRMTVWPVINLLATAILPNVVIFACLIHRAVHCVYHKHKTQALLSNHFILDSVSLHRFGLVLAALGATGLLLSIPDSGYNIFDASVVQGGDDGVSNIGTDMRSFARRELAAIVCAFFKDIFISCKVIIYLVTWPLFRQRALELVSCRGCRRWARRRQAIRRYDKCASERSHSQDGTTCPDQDAPREETSVATPASCVLNSVHSEV